MKKNSYYSFKSYFSKHYFIFFVIFATVLGAFLRLYQISGQIIGDDEWHSIRILVNFPLKHIVTHFHATDNCIPLTFYYKLLLETIGLSEFGLHSLQLVTGIVLLILFPVIIKQIFSEKIAIIFAFLLAISPSLIYYSRYARPYGIVVFLSFISIFSFYFWFKRRKIFYAIMYVVTAVLTSYFSPISFPAVITPLLYVFILSMGGKIFFTQSYGSKLPKLKNLFIIGILLLIGLMFCFLPTLNSLDVVSKKVDQGSIKLITIERFLHIFSGSPFSGSASDTLKLLFVLSFIYGTTIICRKNKMLFGYLFLIISLQLLSLTIIKPFGINHWITFSRYSICCLPLWLLIISIALNDLSTRIDLIIKRKMKRSYNISNIILATFLCTIFIKGPLINNYKTLNNFTNHNEFQYYYTNSLSKISDNLLNLFPLFYLDLKKENKDTIIIETPYIIEWWFNNYNIYQRYHGKRVMIGHNNYSYLSSIWPIMVHKNIKFKNFVNIDSLKALEKCKATYIIIHKNMLEEVLHIRNGFNDEVFSSVKNYTARNKKNFDKYFGEPSRKQAEQLIAELKNTFGSPFYEDKWITVFRIR